MGKPLRGKQSKMENESASPILVIEYVSEEIGGFLITVILCNASSPFFHRSNIPYSFSHFGLTLLTFFAFSEAVFFANPMNLRGRSDRNNFVLFTDCSNFGPILNLRMFFRLNVHHS